MKPILLTRMKEFDIIVFGGTGYTGVHVVRELFLTSEKEGLSWALAGRSDQKMRRVLQDVAGETGVTDYSGKSSGVRACLWGVMFKIRPK